jgi:hypothetical protein
MFVRGVIGGSWGRLARRASQEIARVGDHVFERIGVACALSRPEASKQLIEIQIQISKLLVRFRSLSAQVDEAYGGQVFFRDFDPTDPKNDRRFRCCIQQHWELTKLVCYALKLWQRSYGCDIQDFLTALWAEHTRSNAEKRRSANPESTPPQGHA